MWFATRQVAFGILAVLGTHALTSAIVLVLPRFEIAVLGIQAGSHSVREHLVDRVAQRSYIDRLFGLPSFDFGSSIDGTLVFTDLLTAMTVTIPLLLAVIVGSFAFVAISLWIRSPHRLGNEWGFSFLTFLPSFVPCFVGFALLLHFRIFQLTTIGAILWLAAGFCAAITPTLVLRSQALSLLQNEEEAAHARYLRAEGVGPATLRRWSIRNVFILLLPSIDKWFAWVMGTVMFSEIIFGLAGLGSAAARAVRRSDADLIVGVAVVVALLVNLVRFFTVWARRQYRLEDS
jgi:ABC-type dipeptide/oligopeptide/nickel transport system permease component